MEEKEVQQGMRLNKYIAHCGISNRRQASDIIKGGQVKVNGLIMKNPSYKVQEKDIVAYKNIEVTPLEPSLYVLMNKPKNVSIDKRGDARKSILDIVQPKYKQELKPLGQLGIMDVGLVLLSNNEAILEKLSQPTSEFIRIYHLTLNKTFSIQDLINAKEISKVSGSPFHLEEIDFLDEENHTEIGIELTVGSAAQLHIMFKNLGYEIEKLDCMNFANLTKKDLPRGWFRDLSPKEVVLLNHFL